MKKKNKKTAPRKKNQSDKEKGRQIEMKRFEFVDVSVNFHEAHPILDAVDNPVFNKILGEAPGALIGPGLKKECFDLLINKVKKAKRESIKLTQDERELLLEGLKRAIEYEFLYNDFSILNFKINEANRIIHKSGRTEKALRKAADALGLPRRRWRWETDWSGIYMYFCMLTSNSLAGKKIQFNEKTISLPVSHQKAIEVTAIRYDFPNEEALVKGLRRFNPAFKLPTHSPIDGKK